jgi:hypothetical protein
MPLESYDTTSGIKCNGIFHIPVIGKYDVPEIRIATYDTSWTVVNHIQSNDSWGLGLANIFLDPSDSSGIRLT